MQAMRLAFACLVSASIAEDVHRQSRDMLHSGSRSDIAAASKDLPSSHLAPSDRLSALTALLLAFNSASRWQATGKAMRMEDASRRLGTSTQMQLLGADGKPYNPDNVATGEGVYVDDDGRDPNIKGMNFLSQDSIAGDADLKPEDYVVEEKGIPPDLVGLGVEFDPNFDPTAAPRPKYDLMRATGRTNDVVWGAVAPLSKENIAEWCEHMKENQVERVVGLFTPEEAGLLSPDGTAEGYMKALVDAGFDESNVALVDPYDPDSRSTTLKLQKEASAANQKLVIHAHDDEDGANVVGVVLADWVLTDMIRSQNYLEAVDCLRNRKRKGGVNHNVPDWKLEDYIVKGHV